MEKSSYSVSKVFIKCQKIYYHVGKTHQRRWTVKRGEVYFVDLGENIGSG